MQFVQSIDARSRDSADGLEQTIEQLKEDFDSNARDKSRIRELQSEVLSLRESLSSTEQHILDLEARFVAEHQLNYPYRGHDLKGETPAGRKGETPAGRWMGETPAGAADLLSRPPGPPRDDHEPEYHSISSSPPDLAHGTSSFRPQFQSLCGLFSKSMGPVGAHVSQNTEAPADRQFPTFGFSASSKFPFDHVDDVSKSRANPELYTYTNQRHRRPRCR